MARVLTRAVAKRWSSVTTIIEGLPSLSLRALTGRLRRVDFPFAHPAPDCTPRDDAAPQSELQSGDILITKYSRNGGGVRTDRRLLDGAAAALTRPPEDNYARSSRRRIGCRSPPSLAIHEVRRVVVEQQNAVCVINVM